MWLLAGKTLYFFTVLLSGSGSLRRGAFMSTMLRISAKYSDSYDKIVEYLATDASLGSMEDVIKQLRALRLNKDKNKNKKAKGFLKDLLKELKKLSGRAKLTSMKKTERRKGHDLLDRRYPRRI